MTAPKVSGARVGFSYQRVSAAKQATEKSDGLNRQAGAFLPFCERHGLTPADDHLQDAGVSAFRGKNRRRGALGAFLEAARRGAVPEGAVLVVEDLDRFSRQAPSDALRMLLNEFLGTGLALGVVRFDLVIDEQVFNAPGSAAAIQLQVAMGMAHDYSRKLSERGAASHSSRRAKGAKTANPRPFWCDWDEGAQDFTLNDRAAIPCRMVELCLQGHGMTQIAQILNSEGATTATGKPFTFANVRKVLDDRRLLGERAWTQGGEVARLDHRYFPSIVTVADFDRCWELIGERNNNKGRRGRGDAIHNLFQGSIYCSCGQGLTHLPGRSRQGVRSYAYLRCLGKINHTCTVGGPNHRYDEEWLLRAFMAQRWEKFFHSPADTRQRRALQAREAELEALAAEHRQRAQTAKESLFELMTAGTVTPDNLDLAGGLTRDAAAKAEAVERQRDEIRHQRQQLESRPSGDAMKAQIRQRVEDFLASDRHNLDTRRMFNNWLSTLGVRITLDHGPGTITSMAVDRAPQYLPDGSVIAGGAEITLRGVPRALLDRIGANVSG